MLFAGRKPDHVTGPDFLDWPAFALSPAAAGRDDQRLAERMRVPRRARARLESDAGAGDACRVGRLEQRIDAHRAGEIVGGSFAGRLRTASFYVHRFLSFFRRRLRGGRVPGIAKKSHITK